MHRLPTLSTFKEGQADDIVLRVLPTRVYLHFGVPTVAEAGIHRTRQDRSKTREPQARASWQIARFLFPSTVEATGIRASKQSSERGGLASSITLRVNWVAAV